MVSGTTAFASITYRNDGSATWGADTRLGTTGPRDRTSPFFTPGGWIAANRPASSASTAPGAQSTFSFTLSAPAVCAPTVFTEHFNLVQEGAAWFSDNGQGGPADDAAWFKITVDPVAGACQDAGVVGPDAALARDAGAALSDAGAATLPDAGPATLPGADASALPADAGALSNPAHSGCGCMAGTSSPLAALSLLALALLRRRRCDRNPTTAIRR
jgi:hypothetical protein